MNNSVLLFTKTIPITLAIKKEGKKKRKIHLIVLPPCEGLVDYLLAVTAVYSKLTVAGIGVP